MGVTTETGLGRVGGDSEGLPAGRAGALAVPPAKCRLRGRRPGASWPRAVCLGSARNPPAPRSHRRLPGEDAVARTPLPCLSLRADPPMGNKRDETVRKRSPRKVLAKSSLW